MTAAPTPGPAPPAIRSWAPTPHTDGVIYRCRNNPAELALMLLDRGALDSAALPIAESHDVLTAPGTCDEVVKVPGEVHHLKYVGAGGARLP